MFAHDPARAVSEIRRALQPAGSFAIAVWGPREQNPWLGIVFDAVAAELGRPVPPPGVPGPFSLADATRLSELFGGAQVEELPAPLPAASFEEWWRRTTALAGRLTVILGQMPEGARQAVEARVREAAGAYETPDGLEFPGVSLIAASRR